MLITNEHRHIIKNHMAINNMTQAKFADTTGVNQKTVSDWLSGPFKKVRNSTAYVLLELIPELKALEKRLEDEKEKEERSFDKAAEAFNDSNEVVDLKHREMMRSGSEVGKFASLLIADLFDVEMDKNTRKLVMTAIVDRMAKYLEETPKTSKNI